MATVSASAPVSLFFLAFDYCATCKPLKSFAPAERFELPKTPDDAWVRARRNFDEFRPNYAVTVAAFGALALLTEVRLALLSFCFACIANQWSNVSHAQVALGVAAALLTLTSNFLVLVGAGACVGAVLCAVHATLLDIQPDFVA